MLACVRTFLQVLDAQTFGNIFFGMASAAPYCRVFTIGARRNRSVFRRDRLTCTTEILSVARPARSIVMQLVLASLRIAEYAKLAFGIPTIFAEHTSVTQRQRQTLMAQKEFGAALLAGTSEARRIADTRVSAMTALPLFTKAFAT